MPLEAVLDGLEHSAQKSAHAGQVALQQPPPLDVLLPDSLGAPNTGLLGSKRVLSVVSRSGPAKVVLVGRSAGSATSHDVARDFGKQGRSGREPPGRHLGL